MTWTVSENALMVVFLAAFGVLGFRRGISRELLLVVGIVAAIVVSGWIAPQLKGQINMAQRVARFAVGGGLGSDDPTAAWRSTGEAGTLIESEGDVETLALGVFALIVLLTFLVGQRRVQAPPSVVGQILGAMAGMVNGYLVLYYLLPMLTPRQASVSTMQATDSLQSTITSGQTIARVVAFFVFLLIAFGLYSASAPRGGPGPGPGPDR